MATGVQVWSTTASNNSTSDTNVNWAEGMAPSQVNDSARAVMASVAKWRDDNGGTLITGGSTVAYTLTSNQVATSLTSGYTVTLQFHATNDSSATLSLDGLGAKNLQISNGTNVSSGSLITGQIYHLTYLSSGSGQWLVNSSVPGTNTIAYSQIQQVSGSKVLGNLSTSAGNVSEITIGAGALFQTPVISLFTSTGTATWNSTTSNGLFPAYLIVRMVGGGGGGGGASTTTAVGSAGSSGTDTSFNNWTAIAGAGGPAGAGISGSFYGIGGTGGSGGTNGTGTLIRRVGGSNGWSGLYGGSGGASAVGGAGNVTRGSSSANIGNAASANSGSGGGGAATGQPSLGAAMGAGGAGGEYVEFLVTSPATSYSYTVGGGGTGGSTLGTTGGNGGAGRVEVIAHWQ